MQSPEFKRIKAIFAEALELAGAEREAYLDHACCDDRALRAEVIAYLSAVEEAGPVLDSPDPTRSSAAATGPSNAAQRALGSIIGNYRLVELIGHGGFGTVYRAEQLRPVQREVALKIIKMGMDTQQVIARFEAERQALAMMDHPNIARVFEAGATEAGRPYFVMELVRGLPITEYCDSHLLSTPRRLDVFMEVCRAIQHAHHKGIIHRDIKPSNVLVTVSGEIAVPKVIDFGIAKATDRRLTDQSLHTAAQQFVGTPTYMSPEQTGLGGLDVDTRSDIYSLGVLLYELLTGTTPFDPKQLSTEDYGRTQRIIAEVDPPRPSTRLGTMGEGLSKIASCRAERPQKLRDLVRGELDWIVMKALEKDRARRYQSANDLAHDIERHLKNEPIAAGPPGAIYRVRKFIHRHRPTVVAVACFLILLLSALGLYLHGVNVERRKTEAALAESQHRRIEADRLREESQQASLRAQAAEALADQELVLAAVTQGHGAQVSTRSGRRFDSLKLLADAAKISPNAAVRSQAIACLGLADMRITRQWRGEDEAVCFNHACTMYADCSTGGEVVIRSIPNGKSTAAPIVRITGPAWRSDRVRDSAARVIFSPDDQLIAISEDDQHIRVYDLEGRLVRDLDGGPACDFSPDGAAIAFCRPFSQVFVVDIRTGQLQHTLFWPGGDSLAYSPDGRKLALWSHNTSGDVYVGEIGSGAFGYLPHPVRVSSVAWHPNSDLLATCAENRGIFFCDVSVVAHAKFSQSVAFHVGPVVSVAFSHDGTLLASSSQDGTVRLMDVLSHEPLVRIFCTGVLRFSPDDRTLAVAAYNGEHTLVEVATGSERKIWNAPYGERGSVRFSPDGSIMACEGRESVRFWNVHASATATQPSIDLPLAARCRAVVFHPNGKSVFIATDAGLSQAPMTSELAAAAAPGESPIRQIAIGPAGDSIVPQLVSGGASMQINRDGSTIALAEWGRDAVLLDPRAPNDARKLPDTADALYISISPDGNYIATGSLNGGGERRVRIWNAKTAKLLASLPIAQDVNVGFSPDGCWLVTATADQYCFWQSGSWQIHHTVMTHGDVVGNIVFSPDSKLAALSSPHMGVLLVDARTGVELATLDDEGDERPLAFSPDGGCLVTRGRNSSLRLWDLRRVRAELGTIGLDWSHAPLPAENQFARIAIRLKPAVAAP